MSRSTALAAAERTYRGYAALAAALDSAIGGATFMNEREKTAALTEALDIKPER